MRKKCRKHVIEISAEVLERPEIEVEVEAGEISRDWTQPIDARASLRLTCKKCGEEVELRGYGGTEVHVG
ncbi:MAG: hypothetical protein WCT39_05780 [Candidatus Margulisiibacteriota bacterium]